MSDELLLSHIRYTSQKTGKVGQKPGKLWPYILAIGFCLGLLVGCHI